MPEQAQTDPGTEIDAEDVRLGQLRIHVAHAASPTDGIGVLLYPPIFGLSEAIRRFAAAFARAGMTAVVWDPYNGEDGTNDVAEMVARSKQCEDRAVVADLSEIVDHMKGPLDLDFIGGVGWCFGGRIAILHCGSDDRVGALAAYNPTIWSPTPVTVDGAERGRADFPEQTLDEFTLATSIGGPVQVCRPEHDFTQPAEYDKLIAALSARPDPTAYEYFPAAEHAFSYKPGAANQRAQHYAWSATISLLRSAAGDPGSGAEAEEGLA